MNFAGGLNTGDMDKVRKYGIAPKGPMENVLDITLDEQQRMVAYLDSFPLSRNLRQARLASVREELDALLPSVLDRAFKGEL